MNKITHQTIFICLFCLALASASLGVFKQSTNINLIQTCNNCTYCNITKITSPNSTILLSNLVMTKDGTSYSYALHSNYTAYLGGYRYYYDCGNAAENEVGYVTFEINAIGFESTISRSDAATRGIYFVLALAVIFFVAFLALKTNAVAIRWTFFILSILFCVIGINLISISLYNEIGNTQLGAIFDQLGAASYIIYWFLGGILFIIWFLTLLASLADRKRIKEAEAVGMPTNIR